MPSVTIAVGAPAERHVEERVQIVERRRVRGELGQVGAEGPRAPRRRREQRVARRRGREVVRRQDRRCGPAARARGTSSVGQRPRRDLDVDRIDERQRGAVELRAPRLRHGAPALARGACGEQDRPAGWRGAARAPRARRPARGARRTGRRAARGGRRVRGGQGVDIGLAAGGDDRRPGAQPHGSDRHVAGHGASGTVRHREGQGRARRSRAVRPPARHAILQGSRAECSKEPRPEGRGCTVGIAEPGGMQRAKRRHARRECARGGCLARHGRRVRVVGPVARASRLGARRRLPRGSQRPMSEAHQLRVAGSTPVSRTARPSLPSPWRGRRRRASRTC